MAKGLFNKKYILILLCGTAFYVSSFMINSVCGKYCISLDRSKTASGIVTRVFTLTSFFLRPIWGYFTDGKGRKKIFFTGLALCLLASGLLFAAESVMMLIVARGVFGRGYSAFTTRSATIVCDICPDDILQQGIAIYGITGVISQAVAPVIALGLYDISFKAVAAFVFGLLILSVLSGIFIKYNDKLYLKENIEFSAVEKKALPASFVIFFFARATASVYSFVPIMAEERKIEFIPIFYMLSAFVLLIIRIFNGKISGMLKNRTAFYIGATALFTGFIFMAFSKDILFLLISGVFYGIGCGLVHPVVNTAAVKNSKKENRGLATGTFMMGQDGGMTVGAALWGAVAEKADFTAVYISVAVCVLLMFTVFKAVLAKNSEYL